MVRIVLAHQLIFEQISEESKEKDHADIPKSDLDRKNSKNKSSEAQATLECSSVTHQSEQG